MNHTVLQRQQNDKPQSLQIEASSQLTASGVYASQPRKRIGADAASTHRLGAAALQFELGNARLAMLRAEKGASSSSPSSCPVGFSVKRSATSEDDPTASEFSDEFIIAGPAKGHDL